MLGKAPKPKQRQQCYYRPSRSPTRSKAALPRGNIYHPEAGRVRYTQEDTNSSTSSPAPWSDLNSSRTIGQSALSEPENCKASLMSSLLNPGSNRSGNELSGWLWLTAQLSGAGLRGGCTNDASLDQPCIPENHCLAVPRACSQQSSVSTLISHPTALRAHHYTLAQLGNSSTSVHLPPGASSDLTTPALYCRANKKRYRKAMLKKLGSCLTWVLQCSSITHSFIALFCLKDLQPPSLTFQKNALKSWKRNSCNPVLRQDFLCLSGWGCAKTRKNVSLVFQESPSFPSLPLGMEPSSSLPYPYKQHITSSCGKEFQSRKTEVSLPQVGG